jgi:Mn-dependent DtxR family transcriptional regulator
MTDIKQHEYDLLNEIAQDSMVTQANLSAQLGIAVGSVNWYIKRLVHRGWVKVSHLDRTRLKYDLTPEGRVIASNYRRRGLGGDSLHARQLGVAWHEDRLWLFSPVLTS